MNKDKEILSELIVYMKYSRYLPEFKRRETWNEIVDRNMSMHINKFPFLKEEITNIYENFVRPKKVLPSMRSLQFAGLPIEINNSRLFNCFGRETEFITSEGLRSFEDFNDGDVVTVMTHRGNWKQAVVRNYGQQELKTLTFKKGRSEKRVRATDNHRWILKDGIETTSLKVGDGLKTVNWFNDFNYDSSTLEEKIMWAYGYVYGDGTLVKNDGEYKHSMVRLCGSQIKYHERFTQLGFKSSSPKSIGSDIMIYTGKYLKTLPDPTVERFESIRAFIRGYLDADGANTNYKQGDGTSIFKSVQISKPDSDLQKIKDLLTIAGFFITGEDDYTGQVTNFGVRPNTTRFRGFTAFGNSPHSLWYLRNKSEEISVEDVWCLEVEDDHSFVLDGGIVTGNCSYLPIDDYRGFSETLFLLLSGCGVGYSIQKHHVEKLPDINKPVKTKRYLVADSIIGWSDAVKVLINSYFTGSPKPVFDFRDIREKGAILITSGGKAPGPEPLKRCLFEIEAILDKKVNGEKLTPIECHSILCHIADSVLSGGIRRSAMIALFSFDDNDMLACKSGNWWEENPHFARANNSVVVVTNRIEKGEYDNLWEKIQNSGAGEPGIYFTNDPEYGTNPCVETSLRPFSFCNLVEINAEGIDSQDEFNARSRAASFINTLQASYTDFIYLRSIWKKNTEKDALIGTGITGIGGGSLDKLNKREAALIVKQENERVAKLIGINSSARCTVIKPAGTSSLVLGTSSGIHAYHNDYFIRRIRVNKNEAIYTHLLINNPELLEDELFNPHTTAVISVPQSAPETSHIRTESAITLLERVKEYNLDWVRVGHRRGPNFHNVSATVSIKDSEWREVGEWMWNNKFNYHGLSVLPYSDHTYKQAPFEDCSKLEYDVLFDKLHTLDLSKVIEFEDKTDLQSEAACVGGACEIK